MVASVTEISTVGYLQNFASYLAAGWLALSHEVNGGVEYMVINLGFNYDSYDVMEGANNWDGDDSLEAKKSLGDAIIELLPE
jgi:hypothetical protein